MGGLLGESSGVTDELTQRGPPSGTQSLLKPLHGHQTQQPREVGLLCFFLSDFNQQEKTDQTHLGAAYQEGFSTSDTTGLAD